MSANGQEQKQGGQLIVSQPRETSLVVQEEKSKSLIITDEAPKRTSSLPAPTMRLSGHQKPVYVNRFSPNGKFLASGSADNLVFLWQLGGEEMVTTAMMKGHSAPILDLQWNREGDVIYTASADKTGAMFDVETAQRLKRFRSHTSHVNAIACNRRFQPLVATASDDCTTMLWDTRQRHQTHTFESEYQMTSVALSDDSTMVFSGGIDNMIHCWDIRKGEVAYRLVGHQDSITGLELSPDGSYLLSNGMDNTVRSWDVRPYVGQRQRQMAVYVGAQHDFQKQLLRCSWSPDGSRISAGSADRFVYIWETHSGRILYKLPGHSGCVNDVDFHPTEPIIASCSNDKCIFVGELLV